MLYCLFNINTLLGNRLRKQCYRIYFVASRVQTESFYNSFKLRDSLLYTPPPKNRRIVSFAKILLEMYLLFVNSMHELIA